MGRLRTVFLLELRFTRKRSSQSEVFAEVIVLSVGEAIKK